MSGTDDVLIGRTIDGRYHVKRLIGRGGMGAVYEADHVGLDKRVAIKFLEHEGGENEAVQRFRREARAASKVTHDHVVEIYDVGEEDDRTDYIVMEYLDGIDLDREIKEGGQLEPRRAIAIIRQVLVGLHAIHAAGIIHRDVKPANVLLVEYDGNPDHVKITDFGIARPMFEGAPLTRPSAIVGTPAFMAPEQLGDSTFDHRVDIYACGRTLYVMLAGSLLFDEGKLPQELVEIIRRSTEPMAENRYANAEAFVEAIDQLDLPVRTEPATSVERPSQPSKPSVRMSTEMSAKLLAKPRSHRARVLLLAAVVLMALGGGAIWWSMRDKETAPEPAVKVTPKEPALERGRALERRGDLEGALALYRESFTETSDPEALYRSAEITERLGRASEAARFWRRYLEAVPDAPDRVVIGERIGKLEASTIDAGVPDVAVDAGVIKKPVARGPRQHCKCVVGHEMLCPPMSRPKCRCRDRTDTISLCPRFFKPTHLSPSGCIVANYDSFGTTGMRQGGSCTGFAARDGLITGGRWQCDACRGAALGVFLGYPGGECTGHDRRTGEEKRGRLTECVR